MTSRRRFIRDASTLTLGGLVLPQFTQAYNIFPSAAPYPIGIQLFTLFRAMNDDPKGTLEKVAAVGYQEVESAFSTRGGYYGYTAKEFKSLVAGLGMTWRAHHAGGAPFKPRSMPIVAAGGAPGAATPPAGGQAPAGTAQRPTMDFSKMPPMLNLRDYYQQLVDEAGEGGLSYLVCASTPVATLDEIQKSIEVFQKTGEAA